MRDTTTYVYECDAEYPDTEPKKYNFDMCLWSFQMGDPNAVFEPDRPNCDQQYLYDMVGAKLLEDYWEGYDVCLFAYGQSGAGKSFSMTGHGVNSSPQMEGLIQRICGGTFRLIAEAPKVNEFGNEIKYETFATMLEIYNDVIYDLLPLEKVDQNNRKALEMMNEDIKGIVKVPCTCREDVFAALSKGFENQYKAPTGLNPESSRGHTIFTLIFDKTIYNPKAKKISERKQTISTNMKLVDLAGSERMDKVKEITKDKLQELLFLRYKKQMTVTDEKFAIYMSERLAEGKAINSSLTQLGKCVQEVGKYSAIENEAERNAKMNSIAWRTVTLTRLLRSALSGKCKTIMIAAVSPSLTEHKETISTLTYASNIKKIKSFATKKTVVETAEQKLQRRIMELEAQLAAATASGAPAGGAAAGSNPEADEQLRKELEEARRKEQEARERERELEVKMRELAEAARRRQEIKNHPHLLSILPSDEMVPNALPEGKRVTCGDPDLDPGIPLIGVKNRILCSFLNENGSVRLIPETGVTIVVNGQTVREERVLEHSDRIRIGTANYFRLILPDVEKAQGEEVTNQETLKYTYDYCKNEAMREQLALYGALEDQEAEEKRKKMLEEELQKREAEFRRQQEEERARLAEERRQQAEMLKRLEEEFKSSASQDRAKLEEMQRQREEMEKKYREKADLLEQQRLEEERLRRERIAEEERRAKRRATAKAKLQYDLMDAIPFVRQANEYASELGLDINYQIRIAQEVWQGETQASVHIILEDNKTKRREEWEMDDFRVKYGIIMEEYSQNIINIRDGKPLVFGPNSGFRVGRSFGTLGQASQMMASIDIGMEIDNTIKILSTSQGGNLHVKITPVWPSQDIEDEVADASSIEEVKSLKYLDLDIHVVQALAVPKQYSTQVQVSYEFPDFVATSVVDVEAEQLRMRERELKRETARALGEEEEDDSYEDWLNKEDYVLGAVYKSSGEYKDCDVPQANPQIDWCQRIRIQNLNRRVFEWLRTGSLMFRVRGRSPPEDSVLDPTTAKVAAAAAGAGQAVEVRVNGKTAAELNEELQQAIRQREDTMHQLEIAQREAELTRRRLEEELEKAKRDIEALSRREAENSQQRQQAMVEAVKQGKVSADAELKKELLRLQEEADRIRQENERLQEDARNKALALERLAAGAELGSFRNKIKDVVLPDRLPTVAVAAATSTGPASPVATEGKTDSSQIAKLMAALQEEREAVERERKRAQQAEADLKRFKEEWDTGFTQPAPQPAKSSNSRSCTIA